MAYEDKEKEFSKSPHTIAVIKLDACSLVFGNAPCTATGEACYNTYSTCKDKVNFSKTTKDYKFSKREDEIIFRGIRPYLLEVRDNPTEIKPEAGLAINAKTTIKFIDDENDSDVDVDPYVTSRTSVQGSFFKKLLARNIYYSGRPVEIKSGYKGLTEAEFKTKFKGIIDSIDTTGNGGFSISIKDPLKRAGKVKVPVATKGKVADNPLTAGAVVINLDDATDYPVSGYIRIDDEIIQYSGKTGNQLTGCTRASFSTTAVSHDLDARVQLCKVWIDENPWNIIYDILVNEVAFLVADIDVALAEAERDKWLTGMEYTAVLSQPEDANILIKELCEQSFSNIWWDNETQQIKFKVMAPPAPGVNIKTLTKKGDIGAGAIVDLNEKSRVSRVTVYFAKDYISKDNDNSAYRSISLDVDPDKESANEYNSIAEKVIYSRFIRNQNDAFYIAQNTLRRFKVPAPIYQYKSELKDNDIKTGDLVIIETNDFVDVAGKEKPKYMQVLSKTPEGRNGLRFKAMDAVLEKKYGFIAPNSVPVYDSASSIEKLRYAFIANASNQLGSALDDAFYIW